MGERIGVLTMSTTTGVESIPVASDAVVYSQAINMKYGEYFACGYQADSDGDINLKLEFEQSYDGTNWVESIADIDDSITAKTFFIEKIEPICMPFGRFKITGGDGNDSTTTIKLWLGIKEL